VCGSHLHWQQAVALCMLWMLVAVECDCVGADDDEKVCGDVGGGFGVDHDGDDDSATDNVFAAAAVDCDVTVSAAAAAAAVAADAAAATHRLMRCRLWSRRDNACRFGGSTAGCVGFGVKHAWFRDQGLGFIV
jgi:hypothetical protein